MYLRVRTTQHIFTKPIAIYVWIQTYITNMNMLCMDAYIIQIQDGSAARYDQLRKHVYF